jgi:Ni/Co efflux regulator RcnB
MKRMFSGLMIALFAAVGLTAMSATDADAHSRHWKHRHHHSEDWDEWGEWEDRRHRHARHHEHDSDCGHGYYDRHGTFHLFAGHGAIQIDLGALFGE